MKRYRVFTAAFMLACCVLFVGCAAQPTTAQNAVYQAISLDYETALDITIAYDSLPPCEQPTPPLLCSKAGVVEQLKAAKDKASPTIKTLEATVRAGGSNLTDAISKAQSAVGSYTAVTKPLKVN